MPISAEQRKLINAALKEATDTASIELYADSSPRQHLGASVIGEDCAAKTWYSFRWAKQGSFGGQQLRLFETGKLYEARFIEWFTAAGFQMFPFDERTNKQWRITACEGHFGGSLDSGAIHQGLNVAVLAKHLGQERAQHLANVLEPLRGQAIVAEFKTHNQKNFDQLTKHGVRLSHRKHHIQFNTYGSFYNLEHSLYCGYNKNNDEIHYELHVNDRALCDDMVAKADEIITAQVRPARIAENETYYECKWCSFAGICHRGEPMQKNCRSCRFAQAGPNKSWICTYWNNKQIPDDYIPLGCGQWAQIG